MSTRNPRSKGARTVTARKIDALADDIQLGVDGLRNAAKAYREIPGNHDNTALAVDIALQHIRSFTGSMAAPFGVAR